MDRNDGFMARAEDLMRMFAIAVNTVRLYPANSPLRENSLNTFTEASNAVTRIRGPVQYRIDRHRFIVGDTIIGESSGQVSALAETLHALQVGQLIIAPGLSTTEILHFIEIIGKEPAEMQASGGIRSTLIEAGIENIAAVEVSLRASAEEGILGLDLTTAPVTDIARELVAAAEEWMATATGNSKATDLVATALDRLEPAARDLAMDRCAEALRLLDEETRIRVLASALSPASDAGRMDAMLDVIAHMPPAALARLLRLTALRTDEQPNALLETLALPPELAKELAALLQPAAHGQNEYDASGEVNPAETAAEVTAPTENDATHTDALIRAATSQNTADRGLMTALALTHAHLTEDSIHALAEALEPAAATCAFDALAEAENLLSDLAQEPRFATAAHAAREILTSQTLLRTCINAVVDGDHTHSARALIDSAGRAGTEALLTAYLQSDAARRDRLLPLVSSMIDGVATVATRTLRSGETELALGIVNLFTTVNSRRVASALAIGLEHPDYAVRKAAILALTRCPDETGWTAIKRAFTHNDSATRQLAVRAAGQSGLAHFAPDLLEIITGKDGDHNLKKEALLSLESTRSKQAIPVLSRFASSLTLGRRNRELRTLARQVVTSLQSEGTDTQEGVYREH